MCIIQLNFRKRCCLDSENVRIWQMTMRLTIVMYTQASRLSRSDEVRSSSNSRREMIVEIRFLYLVAYIIAIVYAFGPSSHTNFYNPFAMLHHLMMMVQAVLGGFKILLP